MCNNIIYEKTILIFFVLKLYIEIIIDIKKKSNIILSNEKNSTNRTVIFSWGDLEYAS